MFIRIFVVIKDCDTACERSNKGAEAAARDERRQRLGITPQQSALLKRGNNLDFLCLGEYTFGYVAIALPRVRMAGHYYGNSFTLQKIEIFCPPMCGGRMRIRVARYNENDGISPVGAIYREP
jgi:hypothetical protein